MKILHKNQIVFSWIIVLSFAFVPNAAFCQDDRIDWNKIDIVGPHSKKTEWADISIVGPESKIVDKKFPYIWLTPLAAVPVVYIALDQEKVINPPLVTCRDITIDCGDEIPPPDPSSVMVQSDCTEGPIQVTHGTDQPNNATGCLNDPIFITRTYKIKDGCGNEVLCTHIIFVTPDSGNPSITCPDDLTLNCGDEIPSPDLSKVIVSDDCTPTDQLIVTHLSDEDNGGNGCPGSPKIIIRSYQVSDLCGNTSSCSQTISFQSDNTGPEITIPASDMMVECDGQGNSDELDSWLSDNGGSSADDECSNVTWTNNFSGLEFDCGQTGTTMVEFYATDECGNQSLTTAKFIINDNISPTIECPVDVTISCEESKDPEVTGQPIVSDICSENLTVEYTDDLSGLTECGGTGSLIRTFIVTDECGNTSSCMHVINIEDLIAPVITIPASDLTVECDGQGNMNELDAWLVNNGGALAEDNCSNVIWTNNFSGLDGQCGQSGMTTVEFYAMDECGNQSQTSANFIIVDNEVPTISCPVDLTISCEESTDPAITGQPIATDQCSDNITIEYVDDLSGLTECGGTGTLIRTFTAIDECGNASSCVQVIIIEDLIAPIIACPIDINIECGASIDPANTGWPLVENNCGSFSIEFVDEIIGDCPGVITRVFTVIDECGNSSTCSHLINIAGIGRVADPVINVGGVPNTWSIINQNALISAIQTSHSGYIDDIINSDELPNLPFESSLLIRPEQQVYLSGPFYGVAHSQRRDWGGFQSSFLINQGTGLGLLSSSGSESSLSYRSDYTAFVWEPSLNIKLQHARDKSRFPLHFRVGGSMYVLSMDRMEFVNGAGSVQLQPIYLQNSNRERIGFSTFTSIGISQRIMERGSLDFEIRSQAGISSKGLRWGNRGIPNFNLGLLMDLF